MSWIDKVNNDFVITTGDGISYKPNWLNAQKGISFNVAEFDFPNKNGTLVKRTTSLGRRFPIEIYFQGENHLDVSNEFELSAVDPRPWRITHPLYDNLIVQPTSLLFDNTAMNVTKITGELIETIIEDNPTSVVNPIDNINILKVNVDEAFENTITETFKPSDVNSMSMSNAKNYKLGVPIITIPEEASNYANLFNKASSAINTAISTPLGAVRAIQAFITYPYLFTANVKSRVKLFNDQFDTLRSTIDVNSTVIAKKVYQLQGGTLLAGMALSAANPGDGEYKNSKNILDVIDSLLGASVAFYEDLDLIQSDNGGDTNSFIPDPFAIINLNFLINTVVSNLFGIAFTAKKEFSLILDSDTNVINLTHKLYTLDIADENIDELIENNNWGLDDLLQLKKGKKVIYYA